MSTARANSMPMSEQGAAACAVDDLPWDQFYKELLERRYDGLRESLVAIRDDDPAVDIDTLDEAIDVIVKTGEDNKDLGKVIRAVVQSPHRAVLLVTYLYAWYLQSWEDTSKWGEIRDLIEITASVLHPLMTDLGKPIGSQRHT